METQEKQGAAQGAEAPKENPKQAVKETPVRKIGANLPAVQHPALTLAQTVKTVEELYIKVKQRDKLEMYIEDLTKLEVKKRDEELGDKNHYSGCTFSIRDDRNQMFELRHPIILGELITFLKGNLEERKALIEKQIKLPVKAA
jgi:hypothetical protein